jgi:iron complex transport system substrate-binding protein
MRVVSLLPSATETVCALGVDPVGVTHECDYPPRVRDVPAVVRSTIDTTGSSGAIDERVGDAASDGGVYELDRGRLRELDPDVIVSQGLCDVCAVDESVVRETVADVGLDAEIVATHPHSLADMLGDVERIGEAIDREAEATALVERLRGRIDRVRERTADGETPTATVLDWLDPVMVSGHWVPELVELAGGAFRLAEPGERSGPVEWAALRGADPAVFVAAPCGFSIDRTLDTLDDLVDRPGFADLQAVRDGRAYAMDGNHYLNRPGPRLVDTLEYLAAVLHPDRFETPPTDVVRALPPATEPVT